MLKSDQIKLDILECLKEGEMTLGQLKRKLKIPHHYTLVSALEFLEKLKLVEIIAINDKLGSKKVRLR